MFSLSSDCGRKVEQAIWRLPEKFAPIRGIWEQLTGQLHERSIILPFLGSQVRPVRRPHAVIEGERIDQRSNVRQAILERIRQPVPANRRMAAKDGWPRPVGGVGRPT